MLGQLIFSIRELGRCGSMVLCLQNMMYCWCFKAIIFNLFVNLYVQNCHSFLFADECKIFESFPKQKSDFSSVQSDLNLISISDFFQRM